MTTKTTRRPSTKGKTTAAKKPAAKKAVIKKTVAAKKPASKTVAKKTVAAKKPTVKKTVVTKNPAAKKPATKKAITAKKPATKKAVTKKTVAAKKSPTKKVAVKKTVTKSPAKKISVPQKKATPVKRKQETINRSAAVPLIIEPYPKDYTGLPFLTLIQFRKQPMLVIVDNVDAKLIRAYVLDLCGPLHVMEEDVVLVAAEWFDNNRDKFPLSIEFSRRGMTEETSKIYRTFDVDYVSRVIGPTPEFPMGPVKSVKRRRRKPIPAGMEVIKHNRQIIIGG